MISLIACIGKNRELGLNGDLVFRLKGDMAFFKQTTSGNPILMGRKTCQSLPRALPNRINYVLTSHPETLPPDFIGVTNLSDFSKVHQSENLFVIGGAEVYRQTLPFADALYLTEVASTAKADTFFPPFDKSNYVQNILKRGEENGIIFTISKYIRR